MLKFHVVSAGNHKNLIKWFECTMKMQYIRKKDGARMKKQLLAIAAAALVLATPFAAQAETLKQDLPTEKQIVQYVKKHQMTVSQKGSGVEAVNFVRFLTNADAVKATSTLNDKATHAAKALQKEQNFSRTLMSKTATALLKDQRIGYQYGNEAQFVLYGALINDMNMAPYPTGLDTSGKARSFLIDPALKKVGFGQSGDFTTAYVKATTKASANAKITWPAARTPIQYANQPFSLFLGSNYDVTHASVTVENVKTKKIQTVKKPMKLVKNGLQAISFELKTAPKAGDKYRINVSGLKKKGKSTSISYTVTLFDLQKSLSEYNWPKRVTLAAGETVTLSKKKRYDYTKFARTSARGIAAPSNVQVKETKDAFTITALSVGSGDVRFDGDWGSHTVNVTVK